MAENEPMIQLNSGQEINLDDFENKRAIRNKILIRIAVISGIVLVAVAIVLAVTLTNRDDSDNNGKGNNDQGTDESSEEETEIEEKTEEESKRESEEKTEEKTDEEIEEKTEEGNEKESEEKTEEESDEESEKESEEEKEIPIEVYGKILSIYDITSGEINILSDEFADNNNLFIYINNKKINFNKTYNFDLVDSKVVRFEIISKEFSMKNMFKGAHYLKMINFTQIGNLKITSMESAFESCQNLESFYFDSNLDTSELISMKKAFSYCQKLTDVPINNINLSMLKICPIC